MIKNAHNDTWRAAFKHVGRRVLFMAAVASGVAVGWDLGGPPASAIGAGLAAYMASFLFAKGESR